jgi:hypothetical protein
MDLIYHADVWPHQDASSSVYPSYLSSVSQNSNSYLQRSHATELLNDLHRLLERFLSRDAMSAIRNKINLGSPSVHPLQCIQRSSSSLQPSSTYIYEPLVTSRVRCARDLWLGDLGEGDGCRYGTSSRRRDIAWWASSQSVVCRGDSVIGKSHGEIFSWCTR